MKRKLKIITLLILSASILAGCMGKPSSDGQADPTPKPNDSKAVKTGMAIVTDISGSKSYSDEEEGAASYDVTIAAVMLDDEGIIRSAKIDGISAEIKFNSSGEITSDTETPIPTKNELGEDYGMVKYGGARAEWYKQVDALCEYAVGKTISQFKSGAVDENGRAPEGSDLASSATIYLGGLVSALEEAAKNASHRGAEIGDTLVITTENSVNGSKSSSSDSEGISQLDCNIAAITKSGDTITSCIIDGVQAKVSFDSTGKITTDLNQKVKTKTELGPDYGMVKYGGAKYEWGDQAKSFASYITGKTSSQVAEIAVDENTVPKEADLSSSVTIKIGPFKKLIEKAFK